MYDVIIVGAGPAGLSAALMLGRSRRRVLICDTGRPRNAGSRAIHGYLTRDGIDPYEFLRMSRDELRRYDTVELRDVEVIAAECGSDARFQVTLGPGERLQSRKLLLATGVVDRLPDVPGIHELYGQSVFHCPYCDGWEVRDEPLAILGRGASAVGLSLELTGWSRDLVLCTNGAAEFDDGKRAKLTRARIRVIEEQVARLEGSNGVLQRVVFASGEALQRRALFFTTEQAQQSPLAARLGCVISEKGTVQTGKYESTHLPGLFVAGDASRAVQWVAVAAAEGAEAAFAINTALLEEDLQ